MVCQTSCPAPASNCLAPHRAGSGAPGWRHEWLVRPASCGAGTGGCLPAPAGCPSLASRAGWQPHRPSQTAAGLADAHPSPARCPQTRPAGAGLDRRDPGHTGGWSAPPAGCGAGRCSAQKPAKNQQTPSPARSTAKWQALQSTRRRGAGRCPSFVESRVP